MHSKLSHFSFSKYIFFILYFIKLEDIWYFFNNFSIKHFLFTNKYKKNVQRNTWFIRKISTKTESLVGRRFSLGRLCDFVLKFIFVILHAAFCPHFSSLFSSNTFTFGIFNFQSFSHSLVTFFLLLAEGECPPFNTLGHITLRYWLDGYDGKNQLRSSLPFLTASTTSAKGEKYNMDFAWKRHWTHSFFPTISRWFFH